MCEIEKEDDMKNINQNKCNNGNRMLDNEVLERTKLSNQIIVLVANRSQRLIPEAEAFSRPLLERIIFYVLNKLVKIH
jgi:CxxC motif-containing protein